MLHRRRPFLSSAVIVVGLVTSLGLSSCSSDGNDGVTPPEGTNSSATQPDADDGGDGGDAEVVGELDGSGGTARVTIGEDTWEFDQVVCDFGEEGTGVENAVFNMAARKDQISLYAADEDGRAYLELVDLEAMDDGGLNWNSTGDVVFEVDGQTLPSTLDVVSFGSDGSQDDATAQFEADCA